MPNQFRKLTRFSLILCGLSFGTFATAASSSSSTCPISGALCGAELVNPPEYQGNPPQSASSASSVSSSSAPGLIFSYGKVTLTGLVNNNVIQNQEIETRHISNSGSTLLAGPTMRVAPTQALSIPLQNKLKYNPGDHPDHHSLPMSDSPFVDTVPHGFDVLNLHTHGMHVSPRKYSDNVLLNLFPEKAPNKVVKQCKKQLKGDPITNNMCAKGTWPMQVQLPNQHPSGSYWYHTHKHGAVALHLGSGISGAIIVQDYKNGLESLPGVNAVVKTSGEKIMLIQQIPFATLVTSSASSSAQATAPIPVVNCWGVYNNPVSCKDSQPIVPNTTNSQISVNGQFNAVVTMQTNEAQLWRLVNTMAANVMPVCLIPLNGTGSSSSSSAAAPSAPALYVLAADGNPVNISTTNAKQLPFQLTNPVFDVVSHPQGLVNNEFQFLAPGQRLDLMVKAPAKPGQYVLWSGGTATQMSQLCPTSLSVSDLGSNQSYVVAFVNVVNAPAKSTVNQTVPSQVDLNKLYLPKPVNTAKDTPAAPTQGVVFGFTNVSFSPDDKKNGTKSKIGGTSVVNGRPFYEGQVQRRLQLNQADRWSVQSAADTHMFHIHTNPFQILTRGNLNYPFPVWRDTALINCSPAASGFNNGGYQNCAFPAGLTKQFMSPSSSVASSGANSSNANQSYVANNGKYGEIVQFVSRAVDFTGAIVMHCHNTEHEDNGMMELVEIADKNAKP